MEKFKFNFEGYPIFKGMDTKTIPKVLENLGAEVRRCDAGGVFLEVGDKSRYAWIVMSGVVYIEENDWWGNRNILGRASPGDMFVEVLAFSGIERSPVRAVAAEKTEVLAIKTDELLKPNALNTVIISNLLHLIAMKSFRLVGKMCHITKRRTRDKLLSYLSAEAVRAKSGEFEIPFDRRGLADYLSVDFCGLSTEIAKLRAEGVIECNKNRFRMKKTNPRL